MTTADEALLLLLREARGWLHDVTADFVDRKAAKRDAEELGARIDRALQSAPLPLQARSPEAPRAVPPRKPTDEMTQAGQAAFLALPDGEIKGSDMAAMWTAMYDAAPEAPLPGQSAEGERHE